MNAHLTRMAETARRGALVAMVLGLGSGCAVTVPTVMVEQTSRAALSTLPAAPQTLMGGSGIGLTGRLLTGAPMPQAQGGGVVFPVVQPDLGAVLRLHARTYLSARVAYASAGVLAGLARDEPAFTSDGAFGLDATLGIGHDLPMGSQVGLAFGAELGLQVASLTTVRSSGRTTEQLALPSTRLGLGVYTTPGRFRLFFGGALATGLWNDATATETRTCSLSCSIVTTGRLDVTAIGMAGTGASFQVSKDFSVSLEAWLPLTRVATQLPLMLTLTLRLGDFSVERRERPAPLPPPSPPPLPAPEPVVPVQL